MSYEKQCHGNLWYLVSCMLLEIAKLHEAGGCAWTTVKLADGQGIDKPLGSRFEDAGVARHSLVGILGKVLTRD